jgi:hypothetical protein
MSAATQPPPRHCTGCGGRIWSLTKVTIHDNYNAARYKDLCNDCNPDPDTHDRWEIAVTGSGRRADR